MDFSIKQVSNSLQELHTKAIATNDAFFDATKTIKSLETKIFEVEVSSTEKIIQINYQGRAISIEENAYHIVGASRELYIHGGADRDNESYITEIQFPIANG